MTPTNSPEDELRQIISDIQIIDPHDTTLGEVLNDIQMNALMGSITKYAADERQQADTLARIDERDNMKFIYGDGQETSAPFNLYRYTGDGLLLNWDDRTKELEAQLTSKGVTE